MIKLCVCLGANIGSNSAYETATTQLADNMLKINATLIYGGSKLGLMGILADRILNNGGQVIGVITDKLYSTTAHLNLTKLYTVESMQERKLLMTNMADGFIMLPGGLGTLEEMFEISNAYKLNIHQKPIFLYNIDNFFDNLLAFIERAVIDGFIKPEHKDIFRTVTNSEEIINFFTI